MTDLKLIALDPEDLGILSAHLQDAVLKVGDMANLAREHRFAALVNRFDWAAAGADAKRRRKLQRRRTAIRLDRVTRAQVHGIDVKARERLLVLLAIRFEAGASPAGTIILDFAGGAAIRLEVECIEAEMRDLGAAWAAQSRPDHSNDEKGGVGSGELGRDVPGRTE